MSQTDLAADIRILWRLLRGQPRQGSHAERLAAFYAAQAERYDAFRARLLHGRAELIEALAIPAGASMVELGCGTGGNLDAIARVRPLDTLASVQLVDLCPPLLAVARRRARGLANVQVIEADATLWRPAQPVDRVLLSYSLTMMPDWQAVLANAWAMLAPGGRLGVVDFYLPGSARRFGNAFWRRWFAHDGVHLSDRHLPALRTLCMDAWVQERRAALPYLPGLRAPYYLFVGTRPERACTATRTA